MSVKKYLEKYAEPEVQLLSGYPTFSVQHALLVPCYREDFKFFERLLKTFSKTSLLIAVVINQPESDPDSAPQEKLALDIEKMFTTVWQHAHLSLHTKQQHHLMLIRRYEEGLRIPNKQGVGLARKIAADCILSLCDSGTIQDTWIHSTDADAILPANYFDVPKRDDSSAAVFQFEHIPSGNRQVDVATQLYQQRLNYYVSGLKWAGSGYAFHTIGSCLAMQTLSYAKVRGFPRKSGGEDFYLLNKLAKLGKVEELGTKIQITSRASDRVPFGTGPAVSEIVKRDISREDYKVYNPESFNQLKLLLTQLREFVASDDEFEASTYFTCMQLEYLESQSFTDAFDKWTKQNLTANQMQKHLYDWMDGFRTLKFIHFCRDKCIEDVSIDVAVENQYFTVKV